MTKFIRDHNKFYVENYECLERLKEYFSNVYESKKSTEQDSPYSSRNYEQNEEGRNLQRKSAAPEKQKGVSMFATKKKSFDPSGQLRFDTYKKRSGTTDLGKDYEKLMCALFALKFSTSDIVADFEMKTNSDDCGDFDDVVLKVTFVDGQSQTFLLQLKHSENMKNVTEKMFAAENGAFSLQKYMRSISKFENTENVSFILYTNNSTSIESKSTIYIKNEDKTNDKVVVTELQNLHSEKLLLWSKNENPKENRKKNNLEPQNQEKGTNVFQFELNQSSGSVESFDDYLKRFYFFARQTDVAGAQSLINAMLKEEYGINDATCSSSLLQFMETWWSSNFILTKYDVIAKLAELTLTPFIQTISDSKCNKKSKFLKKAIMEFDMTFVKDTNDEVVASIWNETVSDEEIRLTSLKYYGLCVEEIKDLSPKDRSKVLWHLNKVPLIVKAEECHQKQVKHAIKMLEKIKKRKVVLLANATKEEFPEWRIFQDLSDIQNEGVYTDIVKHFAMSLQDRRPIFLHQLVNFDQDNARIIETTELIKMTQEVVRIGRSQEGVFENYIPRSVSTITFDINKMSEFCKKTGSLLIICNVSQPWNQAIRQLNLHVMELDQYVEPEKEEELSKVDVLLTSNKWPHVRFDEICKKTKKNVHLLQVFDDKSCTSVLTLKSCLDTTTFDKLKINLGRSQKFLEKLKTGDPFGIVSGVTDDNQAIFNHQTYAEYFACAWLKNNLDKVSLLEDELFRKKYQNLKLIFDIMLAENNALHLAVIYRDSGLVSKHLDESEVKDEGGRSPLQLLCTYGVEHPLLLQKKREDFSEEYCAENVIVKLLDRGTNINVTDNFGQNALHFALKNSKVNMGIVKLLIDKGIDAEARDVFQRERSPDVELIHLLLNYGVDANKRDKNKKTALDYAVTSTRSDRVVNILFDARAYEQLISTDYVTFLHYAVYHGNGFAVELFLENGLDLDKIDVNNHDYPLNFAVENQHLRSDLLLKMTEFIQKKKANFGRKRIVELLEEYFSKGHGSDRVAVRDDDHLDSSLEDIKSSSNLCSLDLHDSLDSLYDYSEDEYEYFSDY
ncbi:hypothetical protein MTP99_005362 [Tenebrio molitor]|nr:hypothetical protein MTP99_005362 [Tenebrio molitor]